MEQTQTLPRVEEQRRELTAADRCDSCGAQAWVRALMGTTELLFCAHHGSRHIDALTLAATYVQDDRETLWGEER